ncbi:MAG: GerMN domain-containing protein [Clostridia bacterium]|nr:GerMN domain-containing protein [Clostridia bacterium]
MLRTKKIVILITVFVLAGIAVFTIANKNKGGGKTAVTLYLLSSDKSTVCEYSKAFSEKSSDGLYMAIAESLIKAPNNKKYTAVADKNTEIKSIKNDNGNLTIDFSAEYADAELISTYAVIKTFSQLTDVNAVKVTANGRDVLGLGYVTGDEINLESDDDCATTVLLYFADEDKGKLVSEYRKINVLDTQPIEQYILNELIRGPKAKGHIGLLPKNTDLVSVETTDGTCYVNFKKSLSSKENQELMIYSVVNTLTERNGVNCVQFLIDGKKSDNAGTPDISMPLYRNESLIK